MKDEHIIVTPRLEKIMTEIINKIGRIKRRLIFEFERSLLFFLHFGLKQHREKLNENVI